MPQTWGFPEKSEGTKNIGNTMCDVNNAMNAE